MTRTVVFSCRDPKVADHLVATFKESFQKRVDETRLEDLSKLERDFYSELLKEAEKQEWYDYQECNLGERHAVFVDGKRKLIRLDVEIVPCLARPT